MNIGIVVYSKTGNSYFVAHKIKENLEKAGHSVSLEKLNAFNEDQMDTSKIHLSNSPNIEGYDLVIFGAPVHGFALSAVMKSYLNSIKTLKGLKVGAFVTQAFPFKRMGGEQSIEQFINICKAKGGEVSETGIVNWSSIIRRKQIKNLAKKMLILSHA